MNNRDASVGIAINGDVDRIIRSPRQDTSEIVNALRRNIPMRLQIGSLALPNETGSSQISEDESSGNGKVKNGNIRIIQSQAMLNTPLP